MSFMFILSINIIPDGSAILNNVCIIDDLPAPVLPTMPIFSPGFILNDFFFFFIFCLGWLIYSNFNKLK